MWPVTDLENVRIHGTDRRLLHGVLVLAVKVVEEVHIVQRIFVLHGKINAVLTQDDVVLLQQSSVA